VKPWVWPSSGQSSGRGDRKPTSANLFRPIRGLIQSCSFTHGFTVGYFLPSLRDCQTTIASILQFCAHQAFLVTCFLTWLSGGLSQRKPGSHSWGVFPRFRKSLPSILERFPNIRKRLPKFRKWFPKPWKRFPDISKGLARFGRCPIYFQPSCPVVPKAFPKFRK
jgi:hypothetical protein